MVSDAVNPPKIIDGPYPESKELLADYRLVDVDSLDRALEIAVRSSAAPGTGGVPIQQQIEVRQVLGRPGPRGVTVSAVESLLRELAPRALGVVARRYGGFTDAEDAVQEALVTAAAQWPERLPDNPCHGSSRWPRAAWSRSTAARMRADRREELAASISIHQEETAHQEELVPSADDSLVLLFLCCDDTLSPTLSIPLTLRAVAGLTTREIAAAYLVSEATMAQRISRAKAKLRGRRFTLPDDPAAHLRSVCEVLCLLFNEAYTSSSGPDLTRVDLSDEAIRMTRMLQRQVEDAPEVAGLLSLMLLTHARRPARTSTDGALVPLAQQDRSLWSRELISEGLQLLNATLAAGHIGEYQLLASITALHDEAPSYASTRWAEIARAYDRLESLTGNPMVRLNRAVAVAMVQGPAAGLALLEGLELADSPAARRPGAPARGHRRLRRGGPVLCRGCGPHQEWARTRIPHRAGGARQRGAEHRAGRRAVIM